MPAPSRRQQESSCDYVFIALLLPPGDTLDGGRDGGSSLRRSLRSISLLSGAPGASWVTVNGTVAEDAQKRL